MFLTFQDFFRRGLGRRAAFGILVRLEKRGEIRREDMW